MKKLLIHSLMILFLLPLCAFDESKLIAGKGLFPDTGDVSVSPSEIDDESDDNSDDDDNCRETLLNKSCNDPKGIYPDDGGQ